MTDLLARWAKLPEEDREAIVKLIADHEAVVIRRQQDYAKVHNNKDEVLVGAFKRRRIAAVLARRILGEPDSDQQTGEVLRAVQVGPRFAFDPAIWDALSSQADKAGLEIKHVWLDRACNFQEMMSFLTLDKKADNSTHGTTNATQD